MDSGFDRSNGNFQFARDLFILVAFEIFDKREGVLPGNCSQGIFDVRHCELSLA